MLQIAIILTLLVITTPSINSVDLSLDQGVILPSYAAVQATFEIELMGTKDIPYLYNESDIGVPEPVQQTSRYNVSGEAWVNGAWMNSVFFDTTLSDRFYVECTEEKAINMSSYSWVQWTAPILEDTTYDGEISILFEYGAESGVLQPPWDQAGPIGGSEGKGSATVDTTHARTGTKSIKLWQGPPPKSNGDRRIVLREGIGTSEKDIYWSWWVYFPNINVWNGSANYWHTLGGIGWTIVVDGAAKHNGNTFQMHKNGYIQLSYSNYFDQSDNTIQATNWYVEDHLNQWVHFQTRLKFTNDTSGIAQFWINNVNYLNVTGIRSDPLGFPEWESGGYYFVGDSPRVTCYIYSSPESQEAWDWVDDFVASREKVSENYGVSG